MPYWIKIPLLFSLSLLPLGVILGGYVIFGRISAQPLACSRENAKFTSKQTISNIGTNGLALADFDNDGWDDLLIASYPVKIYKNLRGELKEYSNTFLHNKISAVSGFFADYDNDDWLDLFLLERVVDTNAKSFNKGFYLRPRVLQNHNGNSFEDVTDTVGLSKVIGKGIRGSYAFADFDADGDLDFMLVIRGYINFLLDFKPQGNLLYAKKIIGTLGREKIICGNEEVEQVLNQEPIIASRIKDSFGSTETFLEKKGCIYAENAPAFDPIPPFWELKKISKAFLIIPGEIQVFRNDAGKFVDVGYIVPPYMDYFKGFADVAPTLPWQYISYKLRQPLVTDINYDILPDLFIVNESGRNILLQNEGGVSVQGCLFREQNRFLWCGKRSSTR